jgi:predicted unusual protein kinase regulating ubiquinone biosynthesis (AarF/ABC1/UbiB family)
VADESTLGGRVRRYARVGATVGTAASKIAGGRLLGRPLNRDAHAAELAQALGQLKGPLMKVAQILSTVPDALPPEYAGELAQLQADAPSMGWAFVKRRMNSELGQGWADRFDEFEHKAAFAASLGQVHRAIDFDGRTLACKLQYPDMKSAVEADLSQLKLIFALYKRYDNAIDPSQIHTELSERLHEELDYEREAQHINLYRLMLGNEPEISIPEPVTELSTDRLLTMTWLDGERLMDITDDSQQNRDQLALNMFKAWYTPFYRYGIIHGDPHMGNYTVRPDGGLNLLDFGCIRMFKPDFVGAVINLYKALRDDDQDLAIHAYETWGFDTPNKEMLDVLNQWARFLYAPLLEDKVRPIQENDSSAYGARVAAKVHKELRQLGGIAPPREFVLVDRAAIGLGSVFTRIRAEINWHRIFHELIDDFDERELEKRQKKALKQVGLKQVV